MMERLCNYLCSEQLFNATYLPPADIEIRSSTWVCAHDLDLFQEIANQFGLCFWTWTAKAMANGDLVFIFGMEKTKDV